MNQLRDKDEIIKQLSKQIEDDGLTDITGWIHEKCHPDVDHSGFVRSVAHKLERTGKFEVIPFENWQRFYVKELPKKPFKERNWFLIAAFTFFIGLLIPTMQKFIEQKMLTDSSNINIGTTNSNQDIQKRLDSIEMRFDSMSKEVNQIKSDTAK